MQEDEMEIDVPLTNRKTCIIERKLKYDERRKTFSWSGPKVITYHKHLHRKCIEKIKLLLMCKDLQDDKFAEDITKKVKLSPTESVHIKDEISATNSGVSSTCTLNSEAKLELGQIYCVFDKEKREWVMAQLITCSQKTAHQP